MKPAAMTLTLRQGTTQKRNLLRPLENQSVENCVLREMIAVKLNMVVIYGGQEKQERMFSMDILQSGSFTEECQWPITTTRMCKLLLYTVIYV